MDLENSNSPHPCDNIDNSSLDMSEIGSDSSQRSGPHRGDDDDLIDKIEEEWMLY